MSGPLGSFLGTDGPPRCRVLSEDISVHWWASSATPGDPCLCGAQVKQPDDEESR